MRFLSACIFACISIIVSAQPGDTAMVELNTIDDEVHSNFEQNLDSLLTLWYINNAPGFDSLSYVQSIDTVIPDFPDSVYISRLQKIPSLVDLTYNKIIRRYIDVYSKKRRNNVEKMLGLSEYYFPIFDEIFDYYDVPNELKYMSIIESALNPRAYSRARAVGLWQFMYGTGKLYGLTINSYVDERRDPIKSTHAAARFIKQLHNIYGDWALAIAAYNCGPGNVNKAIRRSGGKKNFWEIYYYLPRETRGHVPAFIAATYIMHYYPEHNLTPRPTALPIPSDTIMINEKLHLKQVSEVLDIPLTKLRDMNPQYRLDIIPGHQAPYSLRLPLDKVSDFISLEDSIVAYNDSLFFNEENVVKAPSYETQTRYEPPADKYAKLFYTIKSGDNLGYISEWYDVRISDLRIWNNIRHNMIRSGQKLVIYVPKAKASKYSQVNSMSFAEKQKMIGKTAEVKEKPLDTSGKFIYYTVKSGDTFWEIAKLYKGVTDTDIMRWNNITNPNSLKAGQQLKIKVIE